MKLTNLGVKFSLLLALVWFIGGGITIVTLASHLKTQAEQTIQERAEIVLTAMQSARDYTQNNIQPLVAAHLLNNSTAPDDNFSQEIIPNFAARSIFANFKEQDPSFRDYLYKEAAVNPTNPIDQADDFEAQLFTQLQPLTTEPPDKRSGYRMLGGTKRFYLARPLIMKDASCLGCHGHPSNAPQSLIDMYGDRHGFGWNLNQIVATQIMYVPADIVFARGRQNLFTVAKTFLSIFGALFITINLLLWRTVIHPLQVLTGTARQMSTCPIDSGQTVPSNADALSALVLRRDEPGQLARAFQYMIHVLGQREQDLQQAVDERTQSLAQEMRDRQAAQSALQTYAHAINHDLRNIVMGIASVVRGLQFRAQPAINKDSIQPMPGQGHGQLITIEPEAMALIEKGCDRQLTLMNRLMEVQSDDVWRLALRLAPVDLQGLISDLIVTYQTRYRSADATLSYRLPPHLPKVRADQSQIQRVFENLMDNALKYNPDGVAIGIEAALIAPDGGGDGATPLQAKPLQKEYRSMVRCVVTDNGVGVDSAKSQSLFQPYIRGSRQEPTTGYGLGLYICREIIAAHGGRIGVETSPTGGAAFWFTLPAVLAGSDKAQTLIWPQ
jgi:signal transduction histidine kinase